MADVDSIVPIWQFDKVYVRARQCKDFLYRFGFLSDHEEQAVEQRIHDAVMLKRKTGRAILTEKDPPRLKTGRHSRNP